jgi:hypothetical protein
LLGGTAGGKREMLSFPAGKHDDQVDAKYRGRAPTARAKAATYCGFTKRALARPISVSASASAGQVSTAAFTKRSI